MTTLGLKRHEVAKITYTKGDGSSSTREIIPTNIPGNVSAMDISDMDADMRDTLLSHLSEYAEYSTEAMKQVMTFQAWLDATHTTDKVSGIKWRSFKPDNISVL